MNRAQTARPRRPRHATHPAFNQFKSASNRVATSPVAATIARMHRGSQDNRSLLQALVADGRPLLLFVGLALVLSGAFALFLSFTGHFLPHDVKFLGMTEQDLCSINQCRIVHFMFHDRVSFGGVLVAIGAIYMWLAEFPLKAREPWAWWLFLLSGIAGFASFLTYLGYGYLDSWHGVATLLLLPCFGIGLAASRRTLDNPHSFRSLFTPIVPPQRRGRARIPPDRHTLGRLFLYTTAVGLIGGGLTIMTVGMTTVFVPQDLSFMGMTAADLRAVNPRLIPLIAHDRAGFGGGVAVAGILLLFCTHCARPSRSLWQVLCFSGAVGFACAVGIHPVIGYTDWFHLLPAVLGAAFMAAGLSLTYPHMHGKGEVLVATRPREEAPITNRAAPT
jgi:hypothetical protein